ncbi:MAG: YdeI/OmpD-associated family protein [Actinomycetota bacterium]
MATHRGGSKERPALFFDTAADFRRWLAKNHATEAELWMGLYKKHVPARGLTWEAAVEEALCYGWIDSQAQRIDEDAVRQRWTPRRPGSTWSNINIALVDRLIAEGRMHPAGLEAYQRRRVDRSGTYAYEQPGELRLPEEFWALLRASKKAAAFWEAATPSYQKTCVSWVMAAKHQSTREKRMLQLIEDSAAGCLTPTQRYGATPKWVDRAAAAARDAG